MPPRKRISKHRELTLPERLELVLGPGGEQSLWETDFLRRKAWQLNRDKLMADINALSRPWAWWRYDAPEPRQITGTRKVLVPFTNKPGRVKCTCGEWHLGYSCVRESELDYLTRLDLLTDGERAHLAALEETPPADALEDSTLVED